MEPRIPTVYTLKTRLWGEVPLIAIKMGHNVRLVARPDFEQVCSAAGNHCPAWFESEDFLFPQEFENALREARKELA